MIQVLTFTEQRHCAFGCSLHNALLNLTCVCVQAENCVPFLKDGAKKPTKAAKQQCEQERLTDLRKALGDIDHVLRFDANDKNPEHSMAWSLRG